MDPSPDKGTNDSQYVLESECCEEKRSELFSQSHTKRFRI